MCVMKIQSIDATVQCVLWLFRTNYMVYLKKIPNFNDVGDECIIFITTFELLRAKIGNHRTNTQSTHMYKSREEMCGTWSTTPLIPLPSSLPKCLRGLATRAHLRPGRVQPGFSGPVPWCPPCQKSAFRHSCHQKSSSPPLAHAHPLRCQIRQSMITRALFLHLSASLLYSSPSYTAICSQFWPCFEASWTSFIIYFLGRFKVKTISSYGHSYHRHTGNFFPSLTWSLMSSLPFGRTRSFINVLGFQ
jgi:hypothetical protein